MLKTKGLFKTFKIKALTKLQMQLLCFVAFIVVGTLYAHFVLYSEIDSYNLLFDFFQNKISSSSFNKSGLFEFVVISRIKLILFLWVIGFTMFAYYIDLFITSYFGFSFGTIISMAIIHNGLYMYGFAILLLFPHYLIYVPIYIYLTKQNDEFSQMVYKNRKVTFRINGQLLLEYFLVLILCLLFVIVGTFCESYLNPEIIEWYLSIKKS